MRPAHSGKEGSDDDDDDDDEIMKKKHSFINVSIVVKPDTNHNAVI